MEIVSSTKLQFHAGYLAVPNACDLFLPLVCVIYNEPVVLR